MGSKIDSDTTKELALLTNIIRQEDLLNGSIFQTFDEIYKIAWAFILKYGVDEHEWGVEMEYEETVVEFAKEYVKRHNLR
jgi:hypothetical protein